MPQPIAYNTGSQTSGSLKLNGIEYAISSSIVSGSNGQKWFTSVNPGNGIVLVTNSFTQSYATYQNSTPLFYTASALTAAAITGAINGLPDRFGLPQFTNTASAFAWVANSRKYFIMNYEYPQIVTDGLIYLSDASFLASYPTTQSVWYNLSGTSSTGSLINNPTFNPNLGIFNFDNTDDQIQILGPDYNALALSGNFTIIITGKKTQYGTGGNNVGNSTLFQGVNNGYDNGWRVYDNNTGTPGTTFSSPHLIQIGLPDLTSGRSVQDTVYRPFFYAFSFTNGNTGLAFLNGITSQGANTYKGTSSPNYGQISNSGFGMGRWAGYIGKVQIYNKGLSLTEINQNYYSGPIVTNGLVFAVDASNLVSYESGSLSTYSLTGSFTGSLDNGTSFSNINGGSWVFDGVDDFINVPINAAFNTPSVTFEVWANLQSINDRHIIYVNWQGNSLEVNSDRSVVMFNFNSAGQQGAQTAGGVIEWNTWNHFVGTYDSGSQTLRTYVNGVLLATRTNTLATIYSVSVHKISGTNFGGEVKGNISIVRHYNRALSAEEVSQNFNAQRSRFGI